MKKIASALIIDDDAAFRTTLQGALRRRGVRAATAATVQEGLTAVEDASVDLIVLDYRLPHGDGLSAVARYRRAAPEAAIIMLTGYGDIPLAVAAVREGADTLLTKPIDADRLIREAVAARAHPRSAEGPLPQAAFNLEDLERETIKAALHKCNGVIANAAKLLGIDRRTLQRKLKRIA